MPPDGLPPAPPLRLHLDRAALAANWRALDRLSGKARAGAAVKANGYGAGAVRVVETLREAGCREFFVAHWREAAELIGLVPAEQIVMLHGPLTDTEAGWARASGVRPVINSPEQAARWIAAGGGSCHLMVDTGMNRLGLSRADLGDPSVAGLEIDVLMSHLASAEDETPLNEAQRKGWAEACGAIAHARSSLANSAGIALGEGYHGDLTRPGLSLYGGVPCAALTPHIAPALRPEAAVLQVRTIAAGDPVGYNATFHAERPMRIGTLALGYADGYLRCWSGKGALRASPGGPALPVLGRVSMDLTIVDLTGAPQVREGDWLCADYDLRAGAETTGLSQYELLTLLGTRFGR